ncbi:MAG TPA: hypothetical protein VJT31_10000 [Rugosimonospora sp.]|nr:hypothetical protein [Rugosimonospora sp.]
MQRRHPITVSWTVTEVHQADIPAGDLAEALGVDLAAFTPAMVTDAQTSDALACLLAEWTGDDTYQNSASVLVTGARPGPAPLSVDALLREADRLLDAGHATGGLDDTGLLLQQLVAAVRDPGAAR